MTKTDKSINIIVIIYRSRRRAPAASAEAEKKPEHTRYVDVNKMIFVDS